jgi:hypothetical protein
MITPKQRFKSRLTIVERIIEVKAANHDQDGDLYIWKWLQGLLLRYNSDRMSSDDTDTDSTGTIYRVKVLVWQRNVDKYIRLIDDERKLSADIFSGSGANSTRRIQSPENPKSSRPPPHELPATLFDPDWLEDFDDNYRQVVLNVSKEDFHWIEFKAEELNDAGVRVG